MTLLELEQLALELDVRSRAHLANRLLGSLESLAAAEVEEIWLEEAERRDAAIEAGELDVRPAAQVFADLRSRLG